MELGVASVKDKRRKSNGCQCGSLPGFSFWMKVVEWGVFCINLYIFCFMISLVQQVWISNLPTKLRFWICFLRGKREALTLSHVQPASPPVRCSSRSLALSCLFSEQWAPFWMHRLWLLSLPGASHHNNKFLHSGTQQRSRYAVELLVLDDGLGVVESIKTHGRAFHDELIGFQGVWG